MVTSLPAFNLRMEFFLLAGSIMFLGRLFVQFESITLKLDS